MFQFWHDFLHDTFTFLAAMAMFTVVVVFALAFLGAAVSEMNARARAIKAVEAMERNKRLDK